jgi:hypothetical protein
LSGVNWTEQQFAEYQRSVAELDPKVAAHRVEMGPQAAKIERPKWNKTEARFALWLEIQQRAGIVAWWDFQPMTFRLADDCRYTPDFVVRYPSRDEQLKCIDIKGSKRKKADGSVTYWAEEDARLKIKFAAEKYPFFDWVICHPLPNGEWNEVVF